MKRPLASPNTTAILALLVLHSQLIAQDPTNRPQRYRNLTQVQAAELERKVDSLIREVGVIESAKVVEIKASVEGPILELIPAGTMVVQGDQMGRLDPSQLEEKVSESRIASTTMRSAVMEAEGSIKRYALQLDSAREMTGKRVELAELNQRVAETEASVRTSDLEDQIKAAKAMRAARVLALEKLKSGDRAELAEAEAEMIAAEADVASLERQLKLNAMLAKRNQTEMQLAVSEAKGDRMISLLDREMKLNQAQTNLDAARHNEEIAANRLKQVEEKLARTVLAAPINGIVSYPVSRRGQPEIEVGVNVREGQTVASIADMDQLQVAVLVNETRISQVRPGQRAAIAVDAFPGREFAGKVKFVNTVPEPTTYLDRGGKRYKVIVAFDKGASGLRLGMTTMVDIDTTN